MSKKIENTTVVGARRKLPRLQVEDLKIVAGGQSGWNSAPGNDGPGWSTTPASKAPGWPTKQ